jgi:hypothetical protein
MPARTKEGKRGSTTQANGRPAKPAPMPVIPENIPEKIRRLDRWVVWRWVWNPAKNGGQGGWDKPPLNARTGRKARTNDPTTWVPFAEALAVHQAGRYDGIGVVLGELEDGHTLTGIDLDDVRDPRTGVLVSWASWVVARLVTYGEVSPSGQGVKLLAYGKLPRGRSDNRRGCEMYDGGRYFTVTGHRLDGTPPAVWDRAAVLADLHAELMGDGKPPADDDRERALEALAHLSKDRAANYGSWLATGMALHSVDPSEAMCAEWDRFSQLCPEKYQPGKCGEKWRTFNRQGLSLGSLIYWAREDGWEEEKGPRLYCGGKPLDGRRKRAGRHQDNGQPHEPAGNSPDSPDHPDDWGEIIPLAPEFVTPDFPADCLPPWQAAWVVAEATATQTPPDLAGMLVLPVAGAALATKFRVQVRAGWSEPTNVFTVTSLPPGDRKSAVFGDVIAPVVAHEREEVAKARPTVAEKESERRALVARQKHLEAQAAKAKEAGERELLGRDAQQVARERSALVVPALPQLFCDDVTPEHLGQLIAQHGGRMLQAAPEGTAIEIAKGRYSENANFDVYLKGHAGDPLRVGRVGRGPDSVDQPALSVALAVQPDVLAGLTNQAGMRGRGFLARLLYSVPPSRVGQRVVAPPAVPVDVGGTYYRTMIALWQLPGNVGLGGKPCPHWLRFSPEADQELRELERWLEPQLAEGEPLSFLAGWGSKLAGAVARIAGILHVSWAVGQGASWQGPIAAATVRLAIRLGREYLLPHAQAAFNLMGADEELEKAQRVLAWILRERPAEFKKWQVHKDVRNAGHFKKIEDLDAPLSRLVRHQMIRVKAQPPRQGTGRPPDAVYEVNPGLYNHREYRVNREN